MKNLLPRRWIATLILVILIVLIAIPWHQTQRPLAITWESLTGPRGSIVWAAAVDPTDSDIIYVGTNEGGIYKSVDGGTAWLPKNDGLSSIEGRRTGVERARDIRDILVSRTQPGAIFVATWGAEGIYRSDDGGDTWEEQYLDVWETGNKKDEILRYDRVYVQVLAETDTDILAGTVGGVFRLVDPQEGLWQPTELKPKIEGEKMFVRALLVHPHRPTTLYAATLGQGIFKSENGGRDWLTKTQGLESKVAREVNALAFDPADPNIIYAGTFGDGVYRSLDGGESWTSWNQGLPDGAEVWSLHFTADEILLAGLRYGGTYKRTASGDWQKANFPYGALTLKAGPGPEMYAGTWLGGLFRDEKGRDESPSDWQDLKLPGDIFFRLRSAVFVPPTLYVSTESDGVYASQDGGQNWERRSTGLAGESLTVWTLAVGPDRRTLYAGTGGGVFSSDDAGKRWHLLGTTQPFTGFSAISLVVDKNIQGEDIIYAGTEDKGLWTFNQAQQTWEGPREFYIPTDRSTATERRVPSLLLRDGVAYASVWGMGVYKGSYQDRRWLPVDIGLRYVETLAHADKGLVQGGGQQFYALTERGLYGSANEQDWRSLYPDSIEAITIDPLHPQVVYASLFTTTLTTQSEPTPPITPTFGVLASLNDGRVWQNAGSVERRITKLVRNPGDSDRIFALAAGGGLYRGQVSLPWLWPDVVVWWLLRSTAFVALVVAPYIYADLWYTYGLSHRLTWGLLRHPIVLLRTQSQRFQNHLQPLEKLILATMDRTRFDIVDVWEKLEEIGVATSRPRLIRALTNLTHHGLLQEREDEYRYATPGLQTVATLEFAGSEDALLEDVRRENRLLRDVERFFEMAGFDVGQDVPQYLTKFVLWPQRPLYRAYRQLYAWLRSEGALRGQEVGDVCQEAVEKFASAVSSDAAPIAFVAVTDIPEVQAFRQMRVWREQLRLIPLSITTIRTALRERSAMRDLDILVQQERSQADLYDLRAPVIDQMDFFGRADTITDLENALRQGHSVDVWSPPGMGKTSLLWHLKETLVTPLVAYADLAYGWPGERLFCEQTIADLTNDLRLKYNRFFDADTDDLESQLRSIAQAVPAGGEREVRVVLLLDGVSMTDAEDEQEQTIQTLRDLADTHTHLALVATWEDPELPVPTWVPLGTLDRTASERLITTIGAQMGLDFTPESLDSIYRATGGHPFLLRQLGSAIARQTPARSLTGFSQVQLAWVDRALSDYEPVRDRYFQDVWAWCSPDQRTNLQAWGKMAEEEKERLADVDPYPRALMQSQVLWKLLMNWIHTTLEENRL